MARRRSPTHQLSISATDVQWELIRERARASGQSMARYLVECGLTVKLAPEARARPALVLGEDEQRKLLRDVGRIVEQLQGETRPLSQTLEEMGAALAFILEARAIGMVREGREEEVRRILHEVLGEERANALGRELGVSAPRQRALL